jgi:hypothetical protein
MDFTPASQNGIIPPSETLTRQSRLGIAISSTATVYGNELILKAISDASMYKTEPVTFYRVTGGNTVSLGTGTWINTNTSVLVTTGITTGTHQLHAVWPGEGLYAPQSTITTPVDFLVNAGYPLGGTISHVANPPTNTVVTGEGAVTFTVTFSTSTVLVDTLSFYIGNTFYGQANIINNVASFTFDELPAGTNNIVTNWPGATIGGLVYEGITYNISYVVKSGTDIGQNLTVSANPPIEVINEGTIFLNATINTSTVINVGNIKFYIGGTLVGNTNVSSNQASLFLPNTLSLGSNLVYAEYDGNPTGHPRYFSFSSSPNPQYIEIVARDTAILSLSDSPDPTLVNTENITLLAELDEYAKVPGGTVTFYDGEAILGTSPMTAVNNAVFTATNLSTGTHELRAYWSGSTTAPKFYGTFSNITTATVVAALPYPGTMTLTGPASVNEIGRQFLTLTGSINTQTVGQATLFQYAPTFTTNTVTSIRSRTTSTFYSGTSFTNPGPTTSSSVTTQGTSSFFNTLSQTLEVFPTSIVSTFSTATTYQNSATSLLKNAKEFRVLSGGRGRFILNDTPLTNIFPGNEVYIPTSYFYNPNFLSVYYTQHTVISIDTSNGYIVFSPQGPNAPSFQAQVVFRPNLVTANTVTSVVTATTSVSSIGFREVSTASFTGTAVLSFDVDSIEYNNFPTQYFKAVWSGQGLAPGQTPYQAKESNVLTQASTTGSITLSVSSSTVIVGNTASFTVTANTSSVETNTVRLIYKGNILSTSSIPQNTSTVVIPVSGTLLSGNLLKTYTMAVGTAYYGGVGGNEYLNSYGSILSNDIDINYLNNTLDYFILDSQVPSIKDIKFEIVPGTVVYVGLIQGIKLHGYRFRPISPITYTREFYPAVEDLGPNDTEAYQGTHYFNSYSNIYAELTVTNKTIISNEVVINVLPKGVTTSALGLSNSQYNFYNSNGTTNTSSVTATVILSQPYPEYPLTGNVTLLANEFVVSTATLTSSTVSFGFVPSSLTTAGSTLIMTALYSGDGANTSSTAATSLVVNKARAEINILSTPISTGTYAGSYLSPVSFEADFPIVATTPSTVNWVINGNFITTTPVVNRKSYLNNLALSQGSQYVSVTYDDLGFYSGSEQQLILIESTQFPGGTIDLTSAVFFLDQFNVDENRFPVQVFWNYTPPEGSSAIPSSCRISATFNWNYDDNGQIKVYSYTTTLIDNDNDILTFVSGSTFYTTRPTPLDVFYNLSVTNVIVTTIPISNIGAGTSNAINGSIIT